MQTLSHNIDTAHLILDLLNKGVNIDDYRMEDIETTAIILNKRMSDSQKFTDATPIEFIDYDDKPKITKLSDDEREFTNISIRLRHKKGGKNNKTIKSVVVDYTDKQLKSISNTRHMDWTSEKVAIKSKKINKYIETNMQLDTKTEITSLPILTGTILFKYSNCGKNKNGESKKQWIIKKLSNIQFTENITSISTVKTTPTVRNKIVYLTNQELEKDQTYLDYKTSPSKDNKTNHIQGRIAEIAHSKLNPTHIWQNHTKEFQKPYDFFNEANNSTIDVKSTSTHKNGLRLNTKNLNGEMADFYYLYSVTLTNDGYTVDLLGSTSKENILNLHKDGQTTNYDNYYVLNKKFLTMKN